MRQHGIQHLVGWGAVGCLLLTSCGEDPVAAPMPQKQSSEREKAINNTEAASVVGYDGEALKHTVQKMVDGAEKQDAKTAEATAAAAGTPSTEEPTR